MMEPLKGKEFEALILFRASKLEETKLLSLCRYGVQAMMIKNPATGALETKTIPSLPDFDGCIAPDGRQLIIEAKVCSQSSYSILSNDKKHPKQLDHMLLRSEFGALCYLLIHFNGRVLVRQTIEPVTYAIMVRHDSHFWRMYQAGQVKSIAREDAALWGIEVPWNLWSTRASKFTPDLSVLIPKYTPPAENLILERP